MQIHITINTSKIPGRKGVSNFPFVFSGFGTIPKFSSPGPNSEDDSEDHPDGKISRIEESKYNSQGVFARFLRREGERERALRNEESKYGPPRKSIVADVFDDLSVSSLPIFHSCDEIEFVCPIL